MTWYFKDCNSDYYYSFSNQSSFEGSLVEGNVYAITTTDLVVICTTAQNLDSIPTYLIDTETIQDIILIDGDFAGYLRYFNNAAATPLAEMYALRGSSDTTGSLVLATSGSERMRITSGGDVEINTGSIKTGEPGTGWGRAAIKIGASVSGAAFNVTRYLPVSVDGTVYYINLNSSTP